MRSCLFDSLKITSVIVGAVIGAGFISGREAMRFFGQSFLLPTAYICFLCLFIFITGVLFAGKIYGGSDASEKLLGKCDSVYKAITLACCVITTGAMAAGMNSLFSSLTGLGAKFPLAGFISLAMTFFVCSKGIRGLSAVSALLVPFMVVCVIICCFVSGGVKSASFGGAGGEWNAALYASMNTFLSMPLFLELGKGKRSGSIILSAVLSALSVSVCVFLIVSVIKSSGAGGDMPLCEALSSLKIFGKIFPLIIFFGIITTMISSYYPLYAFAEKSGGNIFIHISVFLSITAVSLMGLGRIVDMLYPLLGAAGLFFIIAGLKGHLKIKKGLKGEKR